MDIKLDELGNLSIKRCGLWIEQLCPFSRNEYGMIPCGYSCPLFSLQEDMATDGMILGLCHDKSYFVYRDDSTLED